MVIKLGRYGKFLACPNFPDCRNTKPIIEEINKQCPKCTGKVVIRRTKKGRKFYGCENYPKCDFISWNMPADKKCPKCNSFMVIKRRKNGNEYIACSNKECKYQEGK